jgi:hypothetical protein
MRFLSAVVAVTLALSMCSAAQVVKTSGGHGAGASKNEPKSTAPAKATGAGTSNAQSKELQKIEREQPKGASSQPKKTPAPKVLKEDKSSNNAAINFNGKSGGTGSGVGARSGGSLKGRLKQKGQGQAH